MKLRLGLLASLAFAFVSFADKPKKPAEPDCKTASCVRAVDCVKKCGGPVVQTGCCPCPAGTVDSLDCPSDAGR
jgi:hypothetical protein